MESKDQRRRSSRKKRYKWPPNLVDSFFEKAVLNTDERGQIIETLAFVVGVQDSTGITAKELIFPSQTGSSFHVESLGK